MIAELSTALRVSTAARPPPCPHRFSQRQRKAKDFCELVQQPPAPPSQNGKSFLVLFFKKEQP
jgi:hypothetical protein